MRRPRLSNLFLGVFVRTALAQEDSSPSDHVDAVLVTGAAGFVGYHFLSKSLDHAFSHISNSHSTRLVGLDNINSYYDVDLKQARVAMLAKRAKASSSSDEDPDPSISSGQKKGSVVLEQLYGGDVCDRRLLKAIVRRHRISKVLHLAAQAGVRYSLTHPQEYVRNNVECFVDLLEVIKDFNQGAWRTTRSSSSTTAEERRDETADHDEVAYLMEKALLERTATGPLASVESEGDLHDRRPPPPEIRLVYASSSSVYGLNQHAPFAESHEVFEPNSLYAATKRMNELLAKTYFNLYGLSSVGLRFFTVYGPWGRPDMAYFSFAEKILAGEPIEIYHQGKAARDFTFVDDIVDGVARSVRFVEDGLPIDVRGGTGAGTNSSAVQTKKVFELFNLGNSSPVALMDFLDALESALEKKAKTIFAGPEKSRGDVPLTFANLTHSTTLLGYRPTTNIRTGLKVFADWFRGWRERKLRTASGDEIVNF